MKYNIIKVKFLGQGHEFIQNCGLHMDFNEAITLLQELQDNEKCKFAQDVNPIVEVAGLAFFSVINNEVVYQYQMEVDYSIQDKLIPDHSEILKQKVFSN